jgi:outer membrane protein assembly factor BamB
MHYFLTLLFVISFNISAIEKWSRFRGENGQGTATSKLTLKLSKENLKWSFNLKGKGSCSPVIWGSKLFITAEVSAGKIKLFCIDSDKGKELWSQSLNTGNYHVHRFNNAAASTPCLTENQVFVTWFDAKKSKGQLGAFSHEGKQQWVKEIGSFKGKHGFTINPVTADGKVIISHLHQAESHVIAYDCKDGKELWKSGFPSEDVSYSTPLIRKSAKGSEVIVTGPSIGMVSLDFKTGTTNWSLKKSHNMRTVASPIEVKIDGEVYITSSQKNSSYTAIKLPSPTSADPQISWSVKKMGSYVPTHLVRGTSVYILKDSSGSFTEYKIKEQKKIAQVNLSANFYSSPILINDFIYCLSRSGKLFIINPKGLKLVQSMDLNVPEDTDWIDATPAAANDSLYIRLGSRLDCYR